MIVVVLHISLYLHTDYVATIMSDYAADIEGKSVPYVLSPRYESFRDRIIRLERRREKHEKRMADKMSKIDEQLVKLRTELNAT